MNKNIWRTVDRIGVCMSNIYIYILIFILEITSHILRKENIYNFIILLKTIRI